MTVKIQRLVLILQAIFFLAWGGYLLRSHQDAEVIWLQTEPVDPRDLLSGHYVDLRYVIANPQDPTCQAHFKNQTSTSLVLYVELFPKTPVVLADGTTVLAWAPGACSTTPILDRRPDRIWVVGNWSPDRWGRFGLQFGIERYFVNEESSLRSAVSGQVIAKAKVSKSGQLRLSGLEQLLPRPLETTAPVAAPAEPTPTASDIGS